MLMRMTINTRRVSFGYYTDESGKKLVFLRQI